MAANRIDDLRLLAQRRGWTNGAPQGQRNGLMFVLACCAAKMTPRAGLEEMIFRLAREFVPAWSRSTVLGCVTSVVDRARQAGSKDRIEFAGRKFDLRYSLSNKKIIELLSITAEDQRELRCIIGKEEAKLRDRAWHEQRRREAGVPTRAQLDDARRRNIALAQKREAEGWTRQAIADEIGVVVRTVHSYCKLPQQPISVASGAI